jgi:hypothetical protein
MQNVCTHGAWCRTFASSCSILCLFVPYYGCVMLTELLKLGFNTIIKVYIWSHLIIYQAAVWINQKFNSCKSQQHFHFKGTGPKTHDFIMFRMTLKIPKLLCSNCWCWTHDKILKCLPTLALKFDSSFAVHLDNRSEASSLNHLYSSSLAEFQLLGLLDIL